MIGDTLGGRITLGLSLGLFLGLAAACSAAAAPAPGPASRRGEPSAGGAPEIYVDGDAHAEAPPDQCPGDGSEVSPFRSLHCAFASGSILAGSSILVLDADAPYAGADSTDYALPSGTAEAPVTLEPAPGHAPIFTGPLVLVGLDHWVLRDLVLDGSGEDTPPSDAIRIEGGGPDPTDAVAIEGVVVRDWPGRGIVLQGQPGFALADAVVAGNRIERTRGVGIWVQDAVGTRIERNEIAQVSCEPITFSVCDDCGKPEACIACGDCIDAPPEACLAATEHQRGRSSGIELTGSTHDTSILDNAIHDFPEDACGAEGTRTAAMVIAGPQVTQGRIERNLVERIAPGSTEDGHGILVLQSAAAWTIERNVLVEVGRCALCEGDDLFYGSHATTWRHNTVFDATGVGIDIRRATEGEVRGNLVVGAAEGAVRVTIDGIDLPPAFDHNLYWSAVDDRVGQWGEDLAIGLGAWQGACGCDLGSVWADPLLPSAAPLDLTPGAEGLARDLEPPDDLLPPEDQPPFNGQGYDAGALEAPVVLDARIPTGMPDLIVVSLDNTVHPGPDGIVSCAGFTVLANSVPRALAECSASIDALRLTLVLPIFGDPPVSVSYEHGDVTTGATIGRRLGASLPAFVMPVIIEDPDYDEPDDTPDDSDTFGDSTFGDSTFGEDFDGTFFDEDFSFEEGCLCRSQRPASPMSPASLAWLLLVALGRRRAPRRG